jgi:hypothetical protein
MSTAAGTLDVTFNKCMDEGYTAHESDKERDIPIVVWIATRVYAWKLGEWISRSGREK